MPLAPVPPAQAAIENIAFGSAARPMHPGASPGRCQPEHSNAVRGSRRRRVWDLEHTCYCPLVGVGARFTHHDGGLEDNVAALDASMAAADMVICQTGCISHNAYWRVKDHCKRTGKRCLFVENPSTTSLERGLIQVFSQPSKVDETVSPGVDAQ